MNGKKQPRRRFDQAEKGASRTRQWRTQSILHKSASQLGIDLGLREVDDDTQNSDPADLGSQP